LRRLREYVRRKRPELWHNHNWLLHHNNAPAHTSLKTSLSLTTWLSHRITGFLDSNSVCYIPSSEPFRINMVIVPHPPY
jgi:hypothetical protein